MGVELAAIVVQGERAGAPGQPVEAVESQLQGLVRGARRTLARARRTISGYQQVSFRGELDTAVTLLRAAGVPARVEIRGGELPRTLEAEVRAELRRITVMLLRAGETRACVIAVAGDGAVLLAVGAAEPCRVPASVPS